MKQTHSVDSESWNLWPKIRRKVSPKLPESELTPEMSFVAQVRCVLWRSFLLPGSWWLIGELKQGWGSRGTQNVVLSHLAELRELNLKYKQWLFSLNQMETLSSWPLIMLNYHLWTTRTSHSLKMDQTVPAIELSEEAESPPTKKVAPVSLSCVFIRIWLMVSQTYSPLPPFLLCPSPYKIPYILCTSRTV